VARQMHLPVSKELSTRCISSASPSVKSKMKNTLSIGDVKTKASSSSPSNGRLRLLERALLFGGTLLLVLYGSARLDAFLAVRYAMQQIARPGSSPNSSAEVLHGDQQPAALVGVARGDEQGARIAIALGRTKPLAIVQIPAIGLAAPLFEGTDALTLNRGLGRIPGTARPGEPGNIGIAGNRDRTLRALKDIKIGDLIQLNRFRHTDTYIVERISIVNPERVEVLKPRPYSSLTLVTCYPFHFLGAAPKRFVVTAPLANP
jgi:sortase A